MATNQQAIAEGTSSAQTNHAQDGGNGRSRLMNLNEEQLARGLGWFSLGLGLAELLAPRGVAKVAGLRADKTGLIRLFGLREIASGVGIFMRRRPAAAMWSRVVGDALDLTCLGVAFAAPDKKKGRVAFATANVLAVTALDVLCAQQLSDSNGQPKERSSTRVKNSITVNAAPEEVYRFWLDFENLPRFMQHLEAVQVTAPGHSHWIAKGPGGTTVEWEAEITEERPNELIAWQSLENSEVYNKGVVRFEPAPGGRGTIIRVELDYEPPGGVIGKTIAKLFGEEPEQQIYDDLRRLKQVIETGEVIVSEGTVWSNGALSQRPAQPLSDQESGAQEMGRGQASR